MNEMLQEILAFNAFDIIAIFTIVLVEGLLSVDNAVVLASMVQRLPPEKQRKALTHGIWGAIGFRIAAVALASYLIKMEFIKLIAGAYLIYVALKHMFPSQRRMICAKKGDGPAISFWGTVMLVELTDMVFSIDSIAAAVAMSSRLTVVIIGGVLGIIMMRFVATMFIKLLDRYPRLDDIAYQIVLFIGVKIIAECIAHIHIDQTTFWSINGCIVLIGISAMYREKLRKPLSACNNPDYEEYMRQMRENGITLKDLLDSGEEVSADFIRFLIRKGYLEYSALSGLQPRTRQHLRKTGADGMKVDAAAASYPQKSAAISELQSPDRGVAFDDGSEWQSLHAAAESGDAALIENLILLGEDVNVKDPLGRTPLQTAIMNGKNDAVKMLIGWGADMSARDALGQTSLDKAAIYGRDDLRNILAS